MFNLVHCKYGDNDTHQLVTKNFIELLKGDTISTSIRFVAVAKATKWIFKDEKKNCVFFNLKSLKTV